MKINHGLLQCGPPARPCVLNVEPVNFGQRHHNAAGVAQGRFVVAIDQQAERDVMFRQALFIGAAGVKNRVHGVRLANVFRVFQVQHSGASVCLFNRQTKCSRVLAQCNIFRLFQSAAITLAMCYTAREHGKRGGNDNLCDSPHQGRHG